MRPKLCDRRASGAWKCGSTSQEAPPRQEKAPPKRGQSGQQGWRRGSTTLPPSISSRNMSGRWQKAPPKRGSVLQSHSIWRANRRLASVPTAFVRSSSGTNDLRSGAARGTSSRLGGLSKRSSLLEGKPRRSARRGFHFRLSLPVPVSGECLHRGFARGLEAVGQLVAAINAPNPPPPRASPPRRR
jgi:hypothetical protein